jgi:RNA polymerase II subunit A-like phosphatase
MLTRVSEAYELHVYTMGTRAYAGQIARIVDPDGKLFHDRILSREDNISKYVHQFFP